MGPDADQARADAHHHGPPQPGPQPGSAGIQVVRSRRPLQVVLRHRLPCTTAVRTLVDCAAVMNIDEFDALVDTALARRVVDVDALCRGRRRPAPAVLPGPPIAGGPPGRPGRLGSPHPSVLESRMARLFRLHRLPRPKAEVVWGPNRRYRLDFAYPAACAWPSRSTAGPPISPPSSSATTTAAANALARAGWTVLHYDWWEVTYAAERVAAEIADTYRRLAAVA